MGGWDQEGGGGGGATDLPDLGDVDDAVAPTKGSLLVPDGTSWVEHPVGSDGQVLTADSSTARGVRWATPTSGGSLVGAKATLGAHQTFVSGTSDQVGWDTAVWDTDGILGIGGANPERLTIATAGKYEIKAGWWLNDNDPDGVRIAYIIKGLAGGGTDVLAMHQHTPSNAADFANSLTAEDDLAVGDYLYLQLFQDSGGDKVLQGVSRTFMSVRLFD